jgi:NADPH:quinone reductase
MRAVRIHGHGGPEVLRIDDVSEPVPGPGEVLLGVRSAGINFADIERRRGTYEPHLPLPAILGAEAAGVITTVGTGVNPAMRGMRAVGLARASQADLVRMPAAEVVLVPDSVDFDVAAALPVQGLTAYHLLHTMESVTPGMSILVHAIAGGVGLLVLQLAKAAGARVYGTTSTEAKAEVARRLGADAVLVAPDDLAGEVLELTGGHGVDLVLDSVGRATAEASLRCLAPFGHLVFFGEASGPPPPLDIGKLYGRSLRLSVYWLRSPHPPGAHAAALHDLLSDVAAGTLTCTIGLRLPMEKVADAHRAVEERRTAGKIVLRVA